MAKSTNITHRLRELLFGATGGGILYHEVVVSETAELPLLFVVLFLWGLIPMSRADEGGVTMKEVLRGWLGNGGQQQPPDEQQSPLERPNEEESP